MSITPLLIFIFVITLFITELIRRYRVKNNKLVVPTERSAHVIATPQGGGLSIVVVFLITIGLSNTLPTNIIYSILCSGILVAAVGYIDDQICLPAKWRIMVHVSAVIWFLFLLNDGTREFRFISINLHASWIGLFVIVFLLVWMVNLFNFMDGIDGLAASETIFISCAAAYCSWLQGTSYLVFISLFLAASTFGFLILNWSPAKIFMGDVSSGFLGLVLGIIAYDYILEGGIAWTWVILMGVFIVDATLTLFVRIFNKNKLYEAHSNHAYQHAAKIWGHKKVTTAVIFINILWLLPLSTVSVFKPNIAIWTALVALVPLIFIAFKLKVGVFLK